VKIDTDWMFHEAKEWDISVGYSQGVAVDIEGPLYSDAEDEFDRPELTINLKELITELVDEWKKKPNRKRGWPQKESLTTISSELKELAEYIENEIKKTAQR